MAPSIASIRIKLLDSATLQPAADNRDSSPAMQAEMLRRMDLAHNYNAWLLGRARAFLGPRVLDAGAGSGTFTDLLARDHEVVALEQDREFAALLRHRYQNYSNVAVVEGDATELYPDLAPFDAIICFNVLEHVPDDAAMLMRLRLALNPGGSVLLLTPAHPRLYGSMDRTAGHVRRYTTLDIDSLLRNAGLMPIEVQNVNPLGAVGWFVS